LSIGRLLLRCLLILTTRRGRRLRQSRRRLLHRLIRPRWKLALLTRRHLPRLTGRLFQIRRRLLRRIALHHLLKLLLQIGLLLRELRQTLPGLALAWLTLPRLTLSRFSLTRFALRRLPLLRLTRLRLTLLRLPLLWLSLFRLSFLRLPLLRLPLHRLLNPLLRLLHRFKRLIVIVLRQLLRGLLRRLLRLIQRLLRGRIRLLLLLHLPKCLGNLLLLLLKRLLHLLRIGIQLFVGFGHLLLKLLNLLRRRVWVRVLRLLPQLLLQILDLLIQRLLGLI